jgi:NhaP-type Na+/H+ or K+/H+ antiporter
VTVQIVFNLVFIGAAAGLVSGYLRSRAARCMRPWHGEDEPRP